MESDWRISLRKGFLLREQKESTVAFHEELPFPFVTGVNSVSCWQNQGHASTSGMSGCSGGDVVTAGQ